MKKISTMQAFSNEILKEQQLAIGLDLGDRWSFYCVLDEQAKSFLNRKLDHRVQVTATKSWGLTPTRKGRKRGRLSGSSTY